MTQFERSTIDFLILADRAEAVNGKLYMLGGAWDQLNVVDFNQPIQISLALGVLVPWTETNEEQQLEIYIETEDGRRLEPDIRASLNVGRPPNAIKGQSFRSIVAVNGQWLLPGAGAYRVVATLGNGESKKAALYAHPLGAPNQ